MSSSPKMAVDALKILRGAVLFLLLVLVVGLSGLASAQSNGLGITPKLTYTLQPGRQQSGSLYVNNLSTSQPLNLRIRVVDFRAQDESGTPVLLRDTDEPLTPWSLKPYLTLPDTVTIEPGKSKQVPFTIKLPDSIGAGSYYSAIEYTAQNDPEQQRVNVAASSATLMFVTVPGETSQLLNLLQFGAVKDGKFTSIFVGERPQSFAYRVKNGGNVSESPSGSIVIKDMFGNIVTHIDNANPRSELALIGQTRRIEVCNPKSSEQSELGKDTNCQPLNVKPGRYTAEIVLLYGQNGQPSRQVSATASFWYLPIWFLILVALLLLALALAIRWIYKRFTSPHHRHKRSSR